MRRKRPWQERFWEKVDKRGEDECWPWTAARYASGYGVLRIFHRNVRATHAMMYLDGRYVPDGVLCLHSCDNPACVNPRHLRRGTNADNMLDVALRGRSGQRKLDEDEVHAIRHALSLGVYQRTLGRLYGISQAAISLIHRGHNWSHLP